MSELILNLSSERIFVSLINIAQERLMMQINIMFSLGLLRIMITSLIGILQMEKD